MLRTDRLFEIISMIRGAKTPISAASIAEQLEVTPRTIYRYIAMLQSMRIPIEGAVGVGYVMRKGYDLPSLNFNEEELESIVVGLGLLARTGDLSLQSAARRVLTKIETTKVPVNSLRVSGWGIATPENTRLDDLRQAIRQEQKLRICYTNSKGEQTERTVLPIVLTYYVEVAVLSAWCTLRENFRSFRVDKMLWCEYLADHFVGQGQALRQQMDAARTN
jgi:predicted DNA-binding transcriptional regulator YafY